MAQPFKVPTVTVDEKFISFFSEEVFPIAIDGPAVLTDRVGTQNLRFRRSVPGYKTGFHVAGDPTLILIQNGMVRIELQNGDYKDFKAGDAFIAKDYLPDTVTFLETIHGHKAEVLGKEVFMAIHIKLEFL